MERCNLLNLSFTTLFIYFSGEKKIVSRVICTIMERSDSFSFHALTSAIGLLSYTLKRCINQMGNVFYGCWFSSIYGTVHKRCYCFKQIYVSEKRKNNNFFTNTRSFYFYHYLLVNSENKILSTVRYYFTFFIHIK